MKKDVDLLCRVLEKAHEKKISITHDGVPSDAIYLKDLTDIISLTAWDKLSANATFVAKRKKGIADIAALAIVCGLLALGSLIRYACDSETRAAEKIEIQK